MHLETQKFTINGRIATVTIPYMVNIRHHNVRYIMMNHCNELSLSKFMSHKECLSPATVLQICRDLAKALDFLHEVDLSSNLLTSNLNSKHGSSFY